MKAKKILKKTLCLSLALSVMLTLPVSSFAGSLSKTESATGKFDKTWSTYISDDFNDGTKVTLTYGFDKGLISSSDWAYSRNTGWEHRAKIKNSNGTKNGPWEWATEYSDVKYGHKGNSVTYTAEWR